MKKIIVAGPPNGGKGSQLDLLRELSGFSRHEMLDPKQRVALFENHPKLGRLKDDVKLSLLEARLYPSDYHILSTGACFSEISKRDDKFALEVRDMMNQGLLISDEIVERVVSECLDTLEERKFIIFDGFPRTIGQAKSSLLYGLYGLSIINIETDEKICIARAKIRRICEKCKKIHKFSGVDFCECGGHLIVRGDDAKIEKRLEIYKAESFEMINYLKEFFTVTTLDGNQESENIFLDFLLAIS